MTNWQERISINLNICHGKPCIAGTRIMVSVILDNLAEGTAADEIVADYPPLVLLDIQAAISYAADFATGGFISTPSRPRAVFADGADD